MRLLGLIVSGWAAIAVSEIVPIGRILVAPLEARFPPVPLDAEEYVTGIIVLGGDPQRVVEAVKLARRFPQAKLVITGAGEAHEFARAEGVADGRLILETRARNTFENAVFTGSLVDPTPKQRWRLVTSASHMPRAVGCFRKAGFSVLPWPVYDQQPENHYSTRVARHEWLGLLAYRLFGRTDAFFPGPAG